jgi:hypothetical protein
MHVALPNARRRSVRALFSSVITTSVVQDLNEKIGGVDCMMR